MRSVVFDVETTGLEPERGHRIIEIAAIELIDDLPTGDEFHVWVDPQRDIPADASRIHGITLDFLRQQGASLFADVADDFLAFIGDDTLIAHNAKFDVAFLDFELMRLEPAPPVTGVEFPRTNMLRNPVVDTFLRARETFPGMPNNLDALCRRYGIDLSFRDKHNALIDCRLLALVYLGLLGGSQRRLDIPAAPESARTIVYTLSEDRRARPMVVTPEEAAAHASFIKRIGARLWSR